MSYWDTIAKLRLSCDVIGTYLRHLCDINMVRNLFSICSLLCRCILYFIPGRIYVANYSLFPRKLFSKPPLIWLSETKLRRLCDYFANTLRHFETMLRDGKNCDYFEPVQNRRNLIAPLCDSSDEIAKQATFWRLKCELNSQMHRKLD